MPMLVLCGDQPSRRCDWSGHGLGRSRPALACDYQAALVCAPSITGAGRSLRDQLARGEGSSPPGGGGGSSRSSGRILRTGRVLADGAGCGFAGVAALCRAPRCVGRPRAPAIAGAPGCDDGFQGVGSETAAP
jgi:hypothetical protein